MKDHVLAMKRALFWPFLGEGATGFSLQSEILHGPCNDSVLIEEHIANHYKTLLNPIIDPYTSSKEEVLSFLLRHKKSLPKTGGNNDSM